MAAVPRKVRDARTSVWLGGRPVAPRRRVPAGLDLGKIVTVTVRLLDEKGVAGLSMRRLAAELGVTAMSVYWYVDAKDDLLELALDSVYGELRLPDGDGDGGGGGGEDGGDWAAQLRQLAYEHRRMLIAHPWVPRLAGEYPNVGPRAAAFVSTAQRAMRRCGLPEDYLGGGLSLLFHSSYACGVPELRRERDFAFALECVLAGMAAMRDRVGPVSP